MTENCSKCLRELLERAQMLQVPICVHVYMYTLEKAFTSAEIRC